MAARQRGARALLVVTGPRSPNAGETDADDLRHRARRLGHSRRQRQRRGCRRRCSRGGQAAARRSSRSSTSGNPHVAGFALPDVTRHAQDGRRARDDRRRATSSPTSRRRRRSTGVDKPWVASARTTTISAAAASGNSLASKEEAGAIASRRRRQRVGHRRRAGASPRRCRSSRARRNVLLALWSAEEIGLVGSSGVRQRCRRCRSTQIAAYLNFDMVGRMQDNKLVVQATGTSPVWARVLERANVAAGFDLVVQPDPYQPTDVASFNQAERAEPDVHHRRARRLSQAVGHRGQDQLRGSRSHRRPGGRDRPLSRRCRRRRRSSPRSISRRTSRGSDRGRPRDHRHDSRLRDRGQGAAAGRRRRRRAGRAGRPA